MVFFTPSLYMRLQTTLSVYIQHHGPWPLQIMRPWTTLSIQHHGLTNSIHETMDHYLYNTDNHGLFSPIPYMKPETTLSVYITPWSPLINSIHETRDHYLYIQHHGLFFTKSIHETIQFL